MLITTFPNVEFWYVLCLGTLPSDVQNPFHQTYPKDGPVLCLALTPIDFLPHCTASQSDQTTPTHPVSQSEKFLPALFLTDHQIVCKGVLDHKV